MDDSRKVEHAAQGYVQGHRADATPSVVNLNATTAQLGMAAFLALVHGEEFGRWDYAHYDQLTAETLVARTTRRDDCPLCGVHGLLAEGDVLPTEESGATPIMTRVSKPKAGRTSGPDELAPDSHVASTATTRRDKDREPQGSGSALDAHGHRAGAMAIGTIRQVKEWSRYVVRLVSTVQYSVRAHYDLDRLRILLYPSRLTADDVARIRGDDAGVVWLARYRGLAGVTRNRRVTDAQPRTTRSRGSSLGSSGFPLTSLRIFSSNSRVSSGFGSSRAAGSNSTESCMASGISAA